MDNWKIENKSRICDVIEAIFCKNSALNDKRSANSRSYTWIKNNLYSC